MTLLALGELLLRLLGITQTVEALTIGVQAAIAGWGRMLAPLVAPINNTYAIVNDVGHGNVAIAAKLDSLSGSGTYDLNSILAAIAALPAGSAIVIPLPSANSTAVWDEPDPYSGNPMRISMSYAAAAARNLGYSQGLPGGNSPFFTFSWDRYDAGATAPDNAWPTGDWSDILAADTRLSWLTRTEPDWTWSEDTVAGTVSGYKTAGPGFTAAVAQFMLTEQQFQQQKSLRLIGLAPIWPGLANVTLGAPVALSSDLTIAGPLDGLIVSITTPPTALGKFTFGGFTAYYKVGEVSFISDNGEAEPWQYLAFDQALYCPKAMNRAASARLRVLAGAAGTATPWVVT